MHKKKAFLFAIDVFVGKIVGGIYQSQTTLICFMFDLSACVCVCIEKILLSCIILTSFFSVGAHRLLKFKMDALGKFHVFFICIMIDTKRISFSFFLTNKRWCSCFLLFFEKERKTEFPKIRIKSETTCCFNSRIYCVGMDRETKPIKLNYFHHN